MSGKEHHSGDALRRIDRAKLQGLLVAYYRELGWWVERATGDTGFDHAVWVLKRDRDVLLLDCRHWDGAHRPQDAVSSLVRELEQAGANGGILLDTKPFTPADHEAANRHGHVRLIDARDLDGMLGVLPEQRGQADPFVPPLPVPEVARPRPRAVRTARRGNAMWWLIALGCLVVFVLLVRALLARTADTALPPHEPRRTATESRSATDGDRPAPVVQIAPVRVPAPIRSHAMPDATTVDGDRRSEEAMRLIEESTPEL